MPERGHALEPVNFTLANAVQHALVGKLGVEDRGVKRARFVVLKDAATPAILIEGGFLTNPGDAAKIASPTWRESYAAAIAAGIVEFRNLAEKGTKPREKKDW
jgi:N-acetylmuramoyl-L-alanine amidase